jgi:hypothetical protein
VLIATTIARFTVRTPTLSRLLDAVVRGKSRKAAWEIQGLPGLSLRSGYRLWERMVGAHSEGRLDEPTPAFDVYSLGKVIYFVLSGGKRFEREEFKDGDNNLTRILGAPELHDVNGLLDRMIVRDPLGRLQSMESVVSEIDRTIRRIFSPGRHGSARCGRCGKADYSDAPVSLRGGANLFLELGQQLVDVATLQPHVLTCPECGDMQVKAARASALKKV